MTTLTNVIDHAAQMQAQLAQQFKDSVHWQALLNIFGAQVQELENALYGILATRVISTATGDALDGLGDILGVSRAVQSGGLTDAEFRLVLTAQVIAVANSGEPNAMLNIADTILTEWTNANNTLAEGAGDVVITNFTDITTEAKALRAARILGTAAVAGVRPIIEFTISANAGLFQFDAGPGFDVGLLAGSVDPLNRG